MKAFQIYSYRHITKEKILQHEEIPGYPYKVKQDANLLPQEYLYSCKFLVLCKYLKKSLKLMLTHVLEPLLQFSNYFQYHKTEI